MKVLVDTSVWSLALRRHKRMPDPSVQELRSLIDEGRVAMMGPIRQELLSRLRTAEAFEALRYPLCSISHRHSSPRLRARRQHFTNRAKGVPGRNTDFSDLRRIRTPRTSRFGDDGDFSVRLNPSDALHGRAHESRLDGKSFTDHRFPPTAPNPATGRRLQKVRPRDRIEALICCNG